MAKAATEKLPNVPKGDWPGAWNIYRYSKQAVLRNWQVILWLLLLSMLVAVVVDSIFAQKESQFFSNLLSQLLGAVIGLVLIIVSFASVRGKKISFSEAWSKFDPMMYLKYVGSTIIVAVLMLLSFLALVVPFFFVFPRLSMAQYLVVEKGLDPIEAVIQSWNMTKGHSGKVWGITGATIAMVLLMLTIIGIPFALYFLFMYQIAMIVLYQYIDTNKA